MSSRSQQLGGTLSELLVAVSVFAIALGAMFMLFHKSYQSFHFLEQRQSVQSQALRISSALEADFRLTHLYSVGVERNTITVGGQSVRRDKVCCLLVDDWQDPDNFHDANGIPIWNRYAIYRTDLEDNGSLERIVYDPPGARPLPVASLEDLSTLNNNRVRNRQLLCENVLSWQCDVDTTRQVVTQTLLLRKEGARRGLDQKKIEESFEARFRWAPKNTVPRV